MINYRANLQALKDIGVSEIVSINSTGSLKRIKTGNDRCPDDFMTLTATPTIYENSAVHIIPSLNETIRREIIKAALNAHLDVVQKEFTCKHRGRVWKQKRK